MTYNVNADEGVQALDYNALADRNQFAVVDGCAVSINSGTLSQSDTLSLDSGTIIHDGSVVSVTAQDVAIGGADADDPRKDVVYIDGNGDAQVEPGTPEAAIPDTKSRFETYLPVPEDLSATEAVVVEEVWVPAAASSITSSDLRDRRVFALHSIQYLRSGDTEAEVRSRVAAAGYGDLFVVEPGASWTLTATLTIPAGVGIVDSRGIEYGGDYTFTKGFDGDLVEYNDWLALRGVTFDCNDASHTGDGLVPASANCRELRFDTVAIDNAAGAAMEFNETYLSTFTHVHWRHSDIGIRVTGTSHSPWDAFYNCRMSQNATAGIDVEYLIERWGLDRCLIDENGVGIRCVNTSNARPIRDVSISNGSWIKTNDGPGIYVNSVDGTIGPDLSPGSTIGGNNVDTTAISDTVTSPAGDIHCEDSTALDNCLLLGTVGDITRITDGTNRDFVASNVGDVTSPSTFAVILDGEQSGDVSGLAAAIQLSGRGGGRVLDKDDTEIYTRA